MSLQLRLKEVEKTFTALKADTMLSELNDEERRKRLHELTQEEKDAKEELAKDCQELQLILKEARDYAKLLNCDTKEALLSLSYREMKRIHWHIDQTNEPLSNK